MRGVAMIVAVTLAAEVGDLTRFQNPRQLMAYLDLVPSEHSSGESVRRGGITKAGNGEARRVMIEAAWKAQVRLCARYRRLIAAGKPTPVVSAAIAREMLGFAWAIAQYVTPRQTG